jgi:hypothetical protein
VAWLLGAILEPCGFSPVISQREVRELELESVFLELKLLCL